MLPDAIFLGKTIEECIELVRKRLDRPWMVHRFRLMPHPGQCQPIDGDFLVAYTCQLCGSIIDWRLDVKHIESHGVTTDARVLAALAREQEEFAGIKR